jgi:hypothetical protein
MSELKRRLISWSAGRTIPAPGPEQDREGAVIVLEDAAHLDHVLRTHLTSAGSLVLAPAGTATTDDRRVVRYEGSLAEPGADFTVDREFYLQIQGYGVSEYMSIVGPALVRVTDVADLEAFLADADRARAGEGFPEFLIHPVVQLADLPALGGSLAGAGPRHRLHVAGDGTVSTSPGGRSLGAIDDGVDRLDSAWHAANRGSAAPCAVCLAAEVPEDLRAASVSDRPWLGRYLTGVEAVRQVRFRGEPVPAVSGFSGRLNPALAAVTEQADACDANLPQLLWTARSAYVFVPDGSRLFRVERAAAELVEALLVCGSVEAAAAFADPVGLGKVLRFLSEAGVRLSADRALANV